MEHAPKNNPIAKLDFEDARELAHLSSIFQDLGFVVKATKKLAGLLRSGSDDQISIRSIYTAALIAYVRCFASGKRSALSAEIFASLPGEPLVCHAYFKHTRDKHVAHSVNPFEEMLVGAVLSSTDSDQRTVEGVACLIASRVTDDAAGVEQLGVLAAHAQKHIGQRCKDLQEKVLRQAKLLDIDRLYESAGLGFAVQAGSGAARTPRKA